MILPVQSSFLRKRWNYKLGDLSLEPLKFNDDESREYNKECGKVGNLVAPSVIIAEEIEGSGCMKYSLFDNYVQVYKYIQFIKTKGNFPHLYEICPYFTKIHFDLDINNKQEPDFDFELLETNRYEMILKPYLRTIEKVFKKLFPLNYDPHGFLRSVLVFEAHRPGQKISFHIIIDGYYLPCHESWLVCKEVVDSLFEEGLLQTSEFADFSVYKKNQAFRLFGCNKGTMKGSLGLKRRYEGPDIELLSGLVFHGQSMVEHSFGKEPVQEHLIDLRILERSLISSTLGNVRLTLNRTKVSKTNQQMVLERSNKAIRESVLEDEHIARIIAIFRNSPLSKTESGEKAFELEKVAPGDIICLKRLRRSFCSVCERTHDNENCWLSVNKEKEIYFYCRRARDSPLQTCKRVYVGTCDF
jgi:hypothetical protein